MTRTDYVRNEHFVDRYRDGQNTYTVQPDATGTTLTLTVEAISRVPLANKAMDLMWRPEKHIDTWLANIKTAIEARPHAPATRASLRPGASDGPR